MSLEGYGTSQTAQHLWHRINDGIERLGGYMNCGLLQAPIWRSLDAQQQLSIEGTLAGQTLLAGGRLFSDTTQGDSEVRCDT